MAGIAIARVIDLLFAASTTLSVAAATSVAPLKPAPRSGRYMVYPDLGVMRSAGSIVAQQNPKPNQYDLLRGARPAANAAAAAAASAMFVTGRPRWNRRPR
jgi:hypothetical protein